MNRTDTQKDAGVFGTSKADLLLHSDKLRERKNQLHHNLLIADSMVRAGRIDRAVDVLKSINLDIRELTMLISQLNELIVTLPTTWMGGVRDK